MSEGRMSRGFDRGGIYETNELANLLTNLYEARWHRQNVAFFITTTRIMG
jgi:hypothetical protein